MTPRDQIDAALQVLESLTPSYGPAFTDVKTCTEYFRLRLSLVEREVFGCIFLTAKHDFIAYEELFKGTIDAAAVYPREVARAALRHNAAAIVIAHNHPSGNPEPSRSDKAITNKIVEVMNLIDVRTLDHIIVGGNDTVSFTERGLI